MCLYIMDFVYHPKFNRYLPRRKESETVLQTIQNYEKRIHYQFSLPLFEYNFKKQFSQIFQYSTENRLLNLWRSDNLQVICNSIKKDVDTYISTYQSEYSKLSKKYFSGMKEMKNIMPYYFDSGIVNVYNHFLRRGGTQQFWKNNYLQNIDLLKLFY